MSGLRQALTGPGARATLSLLVVAVVFAGVLPRIGDYSAAWDLVRDLTWAETTVLASVALVNLVSYAPLWAVALPGLGWRRAVLTDQASTAVSNTVPAGFAFGVGTTAAMYHSFGHSPAAITRAVVVTGIWNNFVKLGMPVVALLALAVTGDATRALVVAAVLGAAVLVLAVGALIAVLAHRGAARWLAGTGERIAGRTARLLHRPGPSGWVERVDGFRADSRTLLQRRWPALTLAAIGSHAALFLVLLTTLRCVGGAGADVSGARVLAVFALTRLVTLVPVTPGALGVAELSYVAGLTAVGVGAATATGAVLLFRFLTWFVPIPAGVVAWALWRRGVGRRPAPTAERALVPR
ncbi:lysylphosphatidylglycerol synthase transmembrane domain-containing protein [Modestobacter sp. SSW1-42]|uniref:lysylphosphatidylglycerol synthase transmembrane domain-containing protein n=1 Tax=Modestobacter sp. SSW1-42 TaxID=596372 RepID=UPI003987E15D